MFRIFFNSLKINAKSAKIATFFDFMLYSETKKKRKKNVPPKKRCPKGANRFAPGPSFPDLVSFPDLPSDRGGAVFKLGEWSAEDEALRYTLYTPP